VPYSGTSTVPASNPSTALSPPFVIRSRGGGVGGEGGNSYALSTRASPEARAATAVAAAAAAEAARFGSPPYLG